MLLSWCVKLAVPAVALTRGGWPAAGRAPMRSRVTCSAEASVAVDAPSAALPSVKSVSDTNLAFEAAYQRPIVTIWRGSINDMLQVTHLSLVHQDFKYDALFGYGYIEIFDLLLEKYPVPGEKEKLTDATMRALDLDPAVLRADHAEVKAWLEGKTEADVLGAASGDSKLGKALASIAAQEEYLHTRAANIGILMIMEAVGATADSADLERWSGALKMRKRNVERDAVLLKDLKEKMSGAMQIIKQMEIREKKRMAEALEAKAKAAQAKADEAAGATTDAPAPEASA